MTKSDFDRYYMYKKWLEAYCTENDFHIHFNSAQEAVKEDLRLCDIKRNSYLHKALRELFLEYKQNFIKGEDEE